MANYNMTDKERRLINELCDALHGDSDPEQTRRVLTVMLAEEY